MIRGIFWVVLPLGVLLCAMAIVSLAVNGLDVELAGTQSEWNRDVRNCNATFGLMPLRRLV